MQAFPVTHFRIATRYPQSGLRLQLGNSYQWDVETPAPDQRTFLIKIPGMRYFLDSNGQISKSTLPGLNLAVLEDFYIVHRMAKAFTFSHPVHGSLTCKFNKPLEIPEGIAGGNGAVPEFEVELIEVP